MAMLITHFTRIFHWLAIPFRLSSSNVTYFRVECVNLLTVQSWSDAIYFELTNFFFTLGKKTQKRPEMAFIARCLVALLCLGMINAFDFQPLLQRLDAAFTNTQALETAVDARMQITANTFPVIADFATQASGIAAMNRAISIVRAKQNRA